MTCAVPPNPQDRMASALYRAYARPSDLFPQEFVFGRHSRAKSNRREMDVSHRFERKGDRR
jgi:hypothetical protein